MYLHTIKEKNVYRHFYNVFCFCLSWLIRKPSRMAFPRQGRTLLEVFLFSLLLLSLISFSRGTFEGEVEYDDEDSTGCSPCEPGTFYNPNKVNQTEGLSFSFWQFNPFLLCFIFFVLFFFLSILFFHSNFLSFFFFFCFLFFFPLSSSSSFSSLPP